jgi:ferredoxin
MLREIVRLDEARCDGCGDCIGSCAEAAIALVDGQARQAVARSGAAVPVRDVVVAIDGSLRQA